MSGGGAPDFFYREAQRLGYVARSAFKVSVFITFSFNRFISFINKFLLGFQLLQIQNQYKLIKPGSSVLDLGCAPGAWLQVFPFCFKKLLLLFF